MTKFNKHIISSCRSHQDILKRKPSVIPHDAKARRCRYNDSSYCHSQKIDPT